jgi:hypothetical protein
VSRATDRRLDQLAGQLTPQQAVLLWMAEAHPYQTLSAYVDSLKDAPDTKYPMMWLPERVTQAVRSAMKGEKPEVIRRAERWAVREVAFLFSLQLQVNTRLWGEWRAMSLHLAYGACRLRALFREDNPVEPHLSEVRAHLEQMVVEFLEWEVAVGKIAVRYYAGANLLFPASAEQLAVAIARAEQVLLLFNEHLDWLDWERAASNETTKRKLPPLAVEPLDLAALRHTSTLAGTELARHLVVMAQAEAADFLGETRQALQLVRARLWPAAD